MTHAEAHFHGHHGAQADAGERPYFPAAEWEEFQREDIKAGKAIVLEMAAIFTIGLVLYTVIAFIAAS